MIPQCMRPVLGQHQRRHSLKLFISCLQKVAKHAEPAAHELSDRMEEGADKFSKNAGPAAKELSDKAVKVAHDVKEQAGPKAHQVYFIARITWLRFNKDTMSGAIKTEMLLRGGLCLGAHNLIHNMMNLSSCTHPVLTSITWADATQ